MCDNVKNSVARKMMANLIRRKRHAQKLLKSALVEGKVLDTHILILQGSYVEAHNACETTKKLLDHERANESK